MRHPLRWLLRLYPRAWRQRYGDEFETLLHDTGSSWQQIPDIFTEALKMRIAAANWKLLISCALGGMIVAFAGSFAIHDTYISTAVAEITLPPGATSQDALRQIRGLYGKVLPPGQGKGPVQRNQTGLHIDVKATLTGNTQVFSLHFVSKDRAAPQPTVQQILSRLAEENRNTPDQMSLAVLDPPSPPDAIFPNRTIISILGLISGLVFGVLFAWRSSARKLA